MKQTFVVSNLSEMKIDKDKEDDSNESDCSSYVSKKKENLRKSMRRKKLDEMFKRKRKKFKS